MKIAFITVYPLTSERPELKVGKPIPDRPGLGIELDIDALKARSEGTEEWGEKNPSPDGRGLG